MTMQELISPREAFGKLVSLHFMMQKSVLLKGIQIPECRNKEVLRN